MKLRSFVKAQVSICSLSMRVTLAATDRFRLAVRELNWTPDHPDMSTAVLVPARTLADAAKTLGSAAQVTIALGDGLLGLEAGGRRTTVRRRLAFRSEEA